MPNLDLGIDSCERIITEIRHLAMMKEMDEIFEAKQVGSSAMAFKRNSIRSSVRFQTFSTDEIGTEDMIH